MYLESSLFEKKKKKLTEPFSYWELFFLCRLHRCNIPRSLDTGQILIAPLALCQKCIKESSGKRASGKKKKNKIVMSFVKVDSSRPRESAAHASLPPPFEARGSREWRKSCAINYGLDTRGSLTSALSPRRETFPILSAHSCSRAEKFPALIIDADE